MWVKGIVTKIVTNASNAWADRELQLPLDAGKQQLSLKITQGSLKLNYFVITNTGARPTPTPNPPGPVVVLPPAGDNWALKKPITSASATIDIQAAGLAVDGNAGTRWESKHGEDNKRLTIDLLQTIKISDVIINWEAACASQYNVEISTDGVNWTQAFSTTTGVAGEQRITLADTPQGRYLRINCIKRATQYGFSIWEIEAYGTIVNENKIANINSNPISIYPNPVRNKLYIRSESGISGIILSDVNGKMLLEQQANSVDMTNYFTGIYFLTIKLSDGEMIIRKVVKQ